MYILGSSIGCRALRLQDYALELFENWELLIGVVNLGIALALANQKADFLKPL
jgi:hypothetical protein